MLGEQEDLGFMSVSDLSPLPVAWLVCRKLAVGCGGSLHIDGMGVSGLWLPGPNGGADIYQAGRWNVRPVEM